MKKSDAVEDILFFPANDFAQNEGKNKTGTKAGKQPPLFEKLHLLAHRKYIINTMPG